MNSDCLTSRYDFTPLIFAKNVHMDNMNEFRANENILLLYFSVLLLRKAISRVDTPVVINLISRLLRVFIIFQFIDFLLRSSLFCVLFDLI